MQPRTIDYTAALKQSPAFKNYQMGLVQAQQGKLDQAALLLESALEQDATNALIYNALATVYIRQSQLSKALVTCENGVIATPGSPDLLYTLGLVRYQMNRFEEAIQALEQSIALRPDNADAQMWLGNSYLLLAKVNTTTEGGDAAQLDKAIEHFRRATELQPDIAGYYSALAEGLFQRRELPEAREAMESAISLDPKITIQWMSLGRICDQLNDLDAAENAYTQALTIDPSLGKAHYGLGLVYFKREQDDKAVESFRNSLKYRKFDADTHEKLGQTLIRMGKQEEGDQEIQLAKDCRDRDARLGQVRQAVALDPSNAKLANSLGIELANQGDYEEAIQYFQQARNADPRFLDPLYQIAGTYYIKGKLVEAMQTFTEVDRESPGYRKTNFYLSELNAHLGRKSEADRRKKMYESQISAGTVRDDDAPGA